MKPRSRAIRDQVEAALRELPAQRRVAAIESLKIQLLRQDIERQRAYDTGRASQQGRRRWWWTLWMGSRRSSVKRDGGQCMDDEERTWGIFNDLLSSVDGSSVESMADSLFQRHLERNVPNKHRREAMARMVDQQARTMLQVDHGETLMAGFKLGMVMGSLMQTTPADAHERMLRGD